MISGHIFQPSFSWSFQARPDGGRIISDDSALLFSSVSFIILIWADGNGMETEWKRKWKIGQPQKVMAMLVQC